MKEPLRILHLEDEANDAELVASTLLSEGLVCEIRRVDDRENFTAAVEQGGFELVLADYSLPSFDGPSALSIAKEKCPDVPFVFVSGAIGEERAIETLKHGATDYVLKQRLSRLGPAVRRALNEAEERTGRKENQRALERALEEVSRLKEQLEAENAYLQQEIKTHHDFEEIVGKSRTLKKMLMAVETVADTGATVLITGETGTGKELIARAIHDLSPQKNKPLVTVNCAALPPTLIESELFGHEKGAFTGAISRKMGRFELANGGTIFLDEIGDLPLELQAKLLRVLQEGEFERVGGSQTFHVDVRVIAATNRDLEKALAEDKFRHDLYYRLKCLPHRRTAAAGEKGGHLASRPALYDEVWIEARQADRVDP